MKGFKQIALCFFQGLAEWFQRRHGKCCFSSDCTWATISEGPGAGGSNGGVKVARVTRACIPASTTQQGSGADAPFLALRYLFEAANQGHSLVHLQLGIQFRAALVDWFWFYITVTAGLQKNAFGKKTLSCMGSGIRSASEIHPSKRQFLKQNFNVQQLPGYIAW